MTTLYTDRSRIESYQRCPRLRYHEYHDGPQGIGIASARKSLPLVVGGSVHVGLEHLLLGEGEDAAVKAALADFSQFRRALAVDTSEEAAMAQPSPDALATQLEATAQDLGVPLPPDLVESRRNAAQEWEDWLYAEQSALVEAMVRAYARRRLPRLLEEFEVLEVEREGEWELACVDDPNRGCICDGILTRDDCPAHAHVRFMSRPDALLLSRTDHQLYLLSFKTASQWDVRKARDAEHDMQGLSEGVEVERRLGEWWHQVHAGRPYMALTEDERIWEWLATLPAPPRILGIRYEYMLKGSRYEDRDLTQRFSFSAWSQRSHLVRQYVATSVPQSRRSSTAAYEYGDVCWSYDYLRDDGTESKLAWQNWHARPVWNQPGGVRAWIDSLDATQMQMSAYDPTVGMEPHEMGWKSQAQALGLTREHPLDAVFPTPLTVYRSDDQLRDWIEQVEAQEMRVAEAVAQVRSVTDEGERRRLLNFHFPMTRRACEYPSTCAMSKVCWGGDDIRRDPLASGLYKVREPHHEPERNSLTLKGK